MLNIEKYRAWGLLDEEDNESEEERHLPCNECIYNDTIECKDCCYSYSSKFEKKPRKTRQSEFQKLFPHANLISICSCTLDDTLFTGTEVEKCERYKEYTGCLECTKAYWSEEAE